MDSKLVDFPEAAQSTNLAMVDRRAQTPAATTVAKKGDCGRYPAQFGVSFLDRFGVKEAVLL
eukprot:4280686-Alexandrium_andersonii.AAC.1